MRNVLPLLFLVLLCTACNNRPAVHDAPATTAGSESDNLGEADYEGEDAAYSFDYSKTFLHDDIAFNIWHLFSNNEKKDKFTFYVPQGNINETRSVLTIESATGDTLFADTLLTTYLIDTTELSNIADDKDMSNYILRKAREVLFESAFLTPNDNEAIELFGDKVHDVFNDYDTFLELKHEGRYMFRLAMLGNSKAYWGYSAERKKVNLMYSQ